MRIDIPLTPALEAYIRRKIATEPYTNAGEVMREALRLMQEREAGGRAPPSKDDIAAKLKALEPELRARGVASAALFGSIVRGEAAPDSDVDVLIAIDPAAEFSLIDLVAVKNLIGDSLARPVDVVDRDCLKRGVRDAVLAEAETVFG